MKSPIPPGPPYALPLHPDFEKRLTEYTHWMIRFTHHDNVDVAKTLMWRTAKMFVVIAVTMGCIVYWEIQATIAVSLMIGVCALLIIYAVTENTRMNLGANRCGLDIRFLAMLVHHFEYEKRGTCESAVRNMEAKLDAITRVVEGVCRKLDGRSE